MSSPKIKEINVDTWDEFKSHVEGKHYRKWIYRGQSDSSWSLESSLYRSINDAKATRRLGGKASKSMNERRHEEIMLERFKSCAHLYLSHLPKNHDDLSWLSLMQHHGAPTRLLDFSFSPYIALYFALESGSEDAAIYCLNHHSLKVIDDQHFGESRKDIYSQLMHGEENSSEICLFAFEPEFSNQRLIAQQGLFVATNYVTYSHEEALREYNMGDRDAYKLIIGSQLRYEGLRMLHQMNITSGTIYPGLDGFCKSLHKLPVFDSRHQRRVGDET
ncbi:FRG domain-containing protein [Vibrio sp. D420a]|uniref:FRG domain-containing protein n=1 Tax=Vibrio sp. D420a TaxID=2836895 RepID=UPI002553A12F|nr:FRG domain-containing protein [Vibrio sp. D420a]MDK9763256.1 FRG domain-containing protein [Vibrio sp. D420a]